MEKTGNGYAASVEKLLAGLKTVLQDGQELIRVGATELKRRARVGAETTSLRVRENPYQGIGIAFGAGLLLGVLIGGTRRRKRQNAEPQKY